jgi:hypothetical protein
MTADAPSSFFHSWWDFRKFARRVQQINRFVRDDADQSFLKAVFETSKQRHRRIKKNSCLWRAQLGHDWREEDTGDGKMDQFPCPHPQSRMKPLPGKAKEGRANPKGIPHLYMANKRETAVSEVRPWIGSLVSCGIFEVRRDLVVIDFSTSGDAEEKYYFEEPDPEKRTAAVWSHIDRSFSQPVSEGDDIASYIPTQIIAELFKSKGLDGVAYRSAFGAGGTNICLFDIEAAQIEYCELHEVTSIEVGFKEVTNPYWVAKNEAHKEIGTEDNRAALSISKP